METKNLARMNDLSGETDAFVDVLAITVGTNGESLWADAHVTASSVLTDLVAFAFMDPTAALINIFNSSNTST